MLYDLEENEESKESDYAKKKIPKAICSKFIKKSFESLNTLVAKNWARFEYFLDILYSFAVGDPEIQLMLDMSE